MTPNPITVCWSHSLAIALRYIPTVNLHSGYHCHGNGNHGESDGGIGENSGWVLMEL